MGNSQDDCYACYTALAALFSQSCQQTSGRVLSVRCKTHRKSGFCAIGKDYCSFVKPKLDNCAQKLYARLSRVHTWSKVCAFLPPQAIRSTCRRWPPTATPNIFRILVCCDLCKLLAWYSGVRKENQCMARSSNRQFTLNEPAVARYQGRYPVQPWTYSLLKSPWSRTPFVCRHSRCHL